MKTIIINERTKAGKALLELANLLATNNKGVVINVVLGKPAVRTATSKARYNAETEKAIQDAKNGNTFKVKNSKQLFKELGI